MEHRSYQFTHALCREPSPSVSLGLRLDDVGDPDFELLCRQHENYIAALKSTGVVVNILPPRPAFPDGVFVEDAALVLDGVAILLNPGAVSRAGEPSALRHDGETFFKDVRQPDFPSPIDGGDILVFDQLVMVGLSSRTSQDAVRVLTDVVREFDFEVQQVQTPAEILHFKSHCSLLDEKTVIATHSLASSGCFQGFDMKIVPDDEPQGSNVIRVNDKVIMAAEAPKTAKMLEAEGFDVIQVPTSEVAKIDGAVSCCSLRYRL